MSLLKSTNILTNYTHREQKKLKKIPTRTLLKPTNILKNHDKVR